MTKNQDMTNGSPLRLLTLFALPLMFGNVFQQLYTVVDTAVVGRGVGLDALAALGTVDWLTWMVLGIVQGFTQGFSVPMAQDYGRKDLTGLKKRIGNAVRLSVILAALFLVLSETLLPLFLDFLRVPAGIRPMARTYAAIVFAGIPAIVFYNLTASVLRAVGDSRTPLTAMVTAALTNIALDLLTVYVFDWKIAGAAAATVFSQFLSGCICAARIVRSPELRFGREEMKREAGQSRELLGFGIPIAVQNTIIAVGGITVQSVVNGFSVGFIAGFTATNKLYGILEIAALSYGFAVMTYVGQNYGAEKGERIRKGMRCALLLAVCTSLLIAAVVIAVGRPLTSIFISDETPEVTAYAGDVAYRYLVTMCVCLPFLYLLYVYRSALQGLGNTRIPLISGIIELCFRLTVAFVIRKTGYQDGLFFAEVSAWFGAAAILSVSYYAVARRTLPVLLTKEKTAVTIGS